MKTRTLLSTAVLAMVALALTIPALGQSLSGTGTSNRWQIGLYGPNVRNSGAAVYETSKASLAPPANINSKVVTKFTVETVTPSLANGSQLDVFLGPSTNPNEPYGKLVGIINVEGGVGAMILIGARVPTIEKGTTVSIVGHEESVAGELMLKGAF